jgi:hypothetical protein
MLTNIKPDVSNLRTWGCRAYAVVPGPLQRKLSDRSLEAILVGHAPERKAYRLIDLQKRKLFISKDVKFNEAILGYGKEKEKSESQEVEDSEDKKANDRRKSTYSRKYQGGIETRTRNRNIRRG